MRCAHYSVVIDPCHCHCPAPRGRSPTRAVFVCLVDGIVGLSVLRSLLLSRLSCTLTAPISSLYIGGRARGDCLAARDVSKEPEAGVGDVALRYLPIDLKDATRTRRRRLRPRQWKLASMESGRRPTPGIQDAARKGGAKTRRSR